MKHTFIFAAFLCCAATLISCEKEPGSLPGKQRVRCYEYGAKTEGFTSCTRETYSYDNKGRVTEVAYDDGKKQSVTLYTYGNNSITVTIKPSKESPLVTEVYKYTLGEIGFINKITITTEDKTTEYNVLYDADGHLKGVEEGMEMKWTDGEYTGYFLYTLKASNIPFHGFVPYNAIPGAATDAALYRQGLFGKVSAHLPGELSVTGLNQETTTFEYSLADGRVQSVKETILSKPILGEEKTDYRYSRVTWAE